ncbi:ParB/RepB/Spo0J family partition protein [Candidatus Saccharibacteria bacterium]|nr:ParB/RepB/Spo0J family partition protein [Candidatus Saccharibacteria bacterium]
MSARGLGRGFDSLIPVDFVDSAFDPTANEDTRDSKLRELKLDAIIPDPDQPRRKFDEAQISALSKSIKQHGVLQPIVVVRDGSQYKIVAGERRWRASREAGLETIPAIIRSLDAQNRLELSLIENVQREDLNAIETATAYLKLKNQFNLSASQIAERVSKSESAVINTMRLLSLPDSAKHAMIEHRLSEGQMRPLIKATPEQIEAVLPRIIDEHWSARRVEQYMVDLKQRNKKRATTASQIAQARRQRAKQLGQKLDAKVSIHTSARGSGDIVLKFKNEEEFEKLCTILMK